MTTIYINITFVHMIQDMAKKVIKTVEALFIFVKYHFSSVFILFCLKQLPYFSIDNARVIYTKKVYICKK